jgi:DNA (cytosine-5)-methyltransferase 1
MPDDGPLVLSLFPGIGLLDMAFEEAGFCIVRGPDLLWGGDIRRFNPPAGKFDGVIGGPPCQAWSQLRFIVAANGFSTAPDLIPEFERCVGAAQPRWFLMENVPAAPEPKVAGYLVRSEMLRDLWVGGATERLRRFSFGTEQGSRLPIATRALHEIEGEPAVTCDLRRRPVRLGGSRKPKESGGRTSSLNRGGGAETLERMLELSGLPPDFCRVPADADRSEARHRQWRAASDGPSGRRSCEDGPCANLTTRARIRPSLTSERPGKSGIASMLRLRLTVSGAPISFSGRHASELSKF